jgi:hypothetical protein
MKLSASEAPCPRHEGRRKVLLPKDGKTIETLGRHWRDILQREDDNLQELICNNFHRGNRFASGRNRGYAT